MDMYLIFNRQFIKLNSHFRDICIYIIYVYTLGSVRPATVPWKFPDIDMSFSLVFFRCFKHVRTWWF